MPKSEYEKWPLYFEEKDKEHSKIEWLLAQILYFISTQKMIKGDPKLESFFPKKVKVTSAKEDKEARKKKIKAELVNFVVIGKLMEGKQIRKK